MTEATPDPAARTPRAQESDEEIVDADVIEVETAHASETEPVVATLEPDAVVLEDPPAIESPAAPAQQVIYVHAPAAPKKLGNRGIGSILAVVSGIAFTAVFAVVFAVVSFVRLGTFSFFFLAQGSFYIPVLFYVIGAVLLVLVVNRAGWAAYVIGSLFVGALVYFGTIGAVALGQGIVLMTPAEASALVNQGLSDPFVIAAALVAREVSLWTGALIARRGRRLKVRNAEAKVAWEQELADKKADGERAAGATSSAA